MVKQISVIPVNDNSQDEIIQQEEDTILNEDNIKIEDDIIRENDEIITQVLLDVKPKTNGKTKKHNDIPTTEKVLIQVQCPACNKSMSEKNLKYSHAAYCIKRVQEVDKPKAIPVPKKIMKNLMKLKSVKNVNQDVESDDEEIKNV